MAKQTWPKNWVGREREQKMKEYSEGMHTTPHSKAPVKSYQILSHQFTYPKLLPLIIKMKRCYVTALEMRIDTLKGNEANKLNVFVQF